MDDRQKLLFAEDAAPPWELDDEAFALVATVVFPTLSKHEFDYVVPDGLHESVEIGRRVRAPLGRSNRPRDGYLVELETHRLGGRRLKPLLSVIDRRSLLSPEMVRLTHWIARRYLCGWGQVLEAVIPAGVRDQAGTRRTAFFSVSPQVLQRVGELTLPAKQSRVIQYLVARERPATAGEIARAADCSPGPIQQLRRKGLLEVRYDRVAHARPDELPPPRRKENFQLNDDQQKAMDAIHLALDSGEHRTLLLYGVTGSGKTELYIQAIQKVVRYGRQAIVLVPEISLTPQTRLRFRERFDRVAVLHSHMSDVERHHQWLRIADGEVEVVVGARSAVFAPTRHLGLIVIDEEHESSFKQESAPRYHARAVALRRARELGIPLILGTATPSLESWRQAREGLYQLLELPRRVLDRALPPVRTIDLRTEGRRGPFRGAISRPLSIAMQDELNNGGQVILLLNRRGFATHIQCPACGEVMRCPHCDIALTHHRQKAFALCHYCDYQTSAPDRCEKCDFLGIRYSGIGTQRLEAEIQARFPEHRCLRMDTDAMQRHGSHERALAAFRSGEVRILLGTQMIAKGLDFPNVTLVGVINADTALHLPDFRSAERTFQLLAQVAGRSGRGPKGGRVIVQTYNPQHPAIVFAARHDFAGFAEAELATRARLGYPPFGEMVRLIIRGSEPESTHHFGETVASLLQDTAAEQGVEVRILGPAPAPIARIRGKHRYHLQVQSPDGESLREVVRTATEGLKLPGEIEFVVDVDPTSML